MSYRNPDGEVTMNREAALDAWYAIARSVTELTGWTLDAFDPGLKFYDAVHDRTYDVPVALAKRIHALVERFDAYERVVVAAADLRNDGYDGPFMGEAVEPLFQALRVLDGKKCTCGSGAHPRRCNLHPDAYEKHITELEGEEP